MSWSHFAGDKSFDPQIPNGIWLLLLFGLFNNYLPKAKRILVNKNRDEVEVFIPRYSLSLRWIIVLV